MVRGISRTFSDWFGMNFSMGDVLSDLEYGMAHDRTVPNDL
jgi:hypothetical protein